MPEYIEEYIPAEDDLVRMREEIEQNYGPLSKSIRRDERKSKGLFGWKQLGANKFKKLGEEDFQKRDPREPMGMPNLRPAVDALNYIAENRSINKIKDAQLGRKNMYYTAPSLSVRPVQDLSPEILAAQKQQLSRVRSEYAGSDPIMNAINKNLATAQRGKMRTDQIAGRAGQLLQERSRWDEQTRQNQQLAAEGAAKNLDRAQEFSDYKVGVNTAALEAKKKLNAGFLSQIGMNMDTASEYNLKRKATIGNQRQQSYDNAMQYASTLPAGERVAAESKARTDYLIDPNTGKLYPATYIPTYGEAQRGWWSGK